ncbi:MAG: hypothetical protein AAFQ21_07565 [Pseudomonadota bacterium]
MLFLLNDRVIEIDSPEIHLSSRWKAIGCGEPYGLMARDAIEFVRAVVTEHRRGGMEIDLLLAQDLASLIIAKTGANAVLFVPQATSGLETRLTMIPETVLNALRERMATGDTVDVSEIWPLAA